MEFASDDGGDGFENTQPGANAEVDTQLLSRSTTTSERPRRSSDVTSRKELALFQRDRSYAQRRPLLTPYPWHQLRKKSYLDDAERHFGRKETWATKYAEMPDKVTDLTMLITDYLKDLHAQSKLEFERVKKMRARCLRLQRQHQSYVIAGVSQPSILRSWAAEELAKADAKKKSNGSVIGGDTNEAHSDAGPESSSTDDATSSKEDDERREVHRLQRRARGESATLANTSALEELTAKEQRIAGYSSYPFLRQRAASRDSHSLDSSLVDWSAKYFPDDDQSTFDTPKELLAHAQKQQQQLVTSSASHMERDATSTTHQTDERESSASGSAKKHKHNRGYPTGVQARSALGSTLRAHLDKRRASFDAEGAFFHVRPASSLQEGGEGGGSRATPTKQIRSSEWTTHKQTTGGDVVRVDWDTVAKARAVKKTPEVHRARERLVRLTRGEDPSSF